MSIQANRQKPPRCQQEYQYSVHGILFSLIICFLPYQVIKLTLGLGRLIQNTTPIPLFVLRLSLGYHLGTIGHQMSLFATSETSTSGLWTIFGFMISTTSFTLAILSILFANPLLLFIVWVILWFCPLLLSRLLVRLHLLTYPFCL